MDLASVKPHTTTLHLVLPGTSKRIGLALELQSLTSPAVEAVDEQTREDARNLREAGKEADKAFWEEAGVKRYCAAVVGWTWGKDFNGEPGNWGGEQLEFAPENVRKVIAHDVVFPQIMKAAGDEARFFAKLAKAT